MRSHYHRACSYAFKCNPTLYKDLVHQAYIQNYGKDGSNLFDKDILFILKCVRNVWFTYIRNSKYQYEYQTYQKQWYEISDNYEDHGYSHSHNMTPERLMVSQEFVDEFHRRVATYHSGDIHQSINTETLQNYVQLTEKGFNQKEIASLMGTSPQLINYYSRKIKNIVSEIQNLKNPFVANPLPVKKRITRKHYEDHKDKYSEYCFDFERNSDHNEFYQLLVHKEKDEGLLITEPTRVYEWEKK